MKTKSTAAAKTTSAAKTTAAKKTTKEEAKHKKVAPELIITTEDDKQKKVSRTKQVITLLTPFIEKGIHTRKELLDIVKANIEIKESTAKTILTDAKNPKYFQFERLVVEDEKGCLSFKS